jgi:hypothetical protein
MPRRLLTRSAATAVAACAVVLSSAAASTAATQQANAVPVSVAITSVSPDYATPGKPVTVSGTLTNISSGTITGLSIRLRSSAGFFTSRQELQEYADGNIPYFDQQLPGLDKPLTNPLAPRETVPWSVTIPAAQLPMTQYGVYPLAAEVDSTDQTQLAVSRTFLPFWPGKKALGDPLRQDVAWIWPLIDQPACPGLVNSGLAASFGSGGRLAGLLDAGDANSGSAHLTWVIDPALLASAAKMNRPYAAARTGSCQGSSRRASRAPGAWLAQLKSATAGQQVVVTPYDDANIAALTRYGLNADLDSAFSEGRDVADRALGRDFSPTAGGTAASANRIAWPTDGSANRMDLANLAASEGIAAVVLDSSAMPPSQQPNYTPAAQTTTPDGQGSGMTVLLSDDTITRLIGSANSPSDSQATKFSVEQRYLAETAMIAAELPGVARSIVVAPPREWNPPAGLASELLQETVRAPWLRPVSLADLAAVRHPAGEVSRQAPPEMVGSAQLGRSLVSQVRELDQQVQLLKSIQASPAPGLDRAMFAIESSAWADGGQAGQVALAQQISSNLAGQEGRLKIVVPGAIGQTAGREQLTGKTGTVPLSISNRGRYNVIVRLQADPGRGLTVQKESAPITVAAGAQQIVKLRVTATAAGSTVLTLRLLTPGGVPIPGTTASVTIQATDYGTLALVIIAAVLGAFMISSGVRTFRRRGRRPRHGAGGGDQRGSPDAPLAPPERGVEPEKAHVSDVTGLPASRNRAEKSDTVVSDRINAGHANGRDSAEVGETDDYAWTPGWTERR